MFNLRDFLEDFEFKKYLNWIIGGGSVLGILLLILIINLCGGVPISQNSFTKNLDNSIKSEAKLDKARLVFTPLPVVKLTNFEMKTEALSLKAQKVYLKKSLFSFLSFKNSKLKEIFISDGELIFYKGSDTQTFPSLFNSMIENVNIVNLKSGYSVVLKNTNITVDSEMYLTHFKNVDITYKNKASYYSLKGRANYLGTNVNIDAVINKSTDPMHETRRSNIKLKSEVVNLDIQHSENIANSTPTESSTSLNIKIFQPIRFLSYFMGKNALIFEKFDKNFKPKGTVNVNLNFKHDLVNHTFNTLAGDINSSTISGKIKLSDVLDEFNQSKPHVEVILSNLDLREFPQKTNDETQNMANRKDVDFFKFSDIFDSGDFFLNILVESLKVHKHEYNFDLEIDKTMHDISVDLKKFQEQNGIEMSGTGFIQDSLSLYPKLFLTTDIKGSNLRELSELLGNLDLEKVVKFEALGKFKANAELVLKSNVIVVPHFEINFEGTQASVKGTFQRKYPSINNPKYQNILEFNIQNMDYTEQNIKTDFLKQKYNLLLSSLPLNKLKTTSYNKINCVDCKIGERKFSVINFATVINDGIFAIKDGYIKSEKLDLSFDAAVEISSSIPLISFNLKSKKLDLSDINFPKALEAIQNGVFLPNLERFSGFGMVNLEGISTANYTFQPLSAMIDVSNGILSFPQTNLQMDNKNTKQKASAQLTAQMNLQKNPSVSIAYNLTNIAAQSFVEFFTKSRTVRGNMSINGNFKGEGESVKDIFSNGAGSGKFYIIAPQIQGLSLEVAEKYTLSHNKNILMTLTKDKIDNLIFDKNAFGKLNSVEGGYIINSNQVMISGVDIKSKATNISLNGQYSILTQAFSFSGRGVTAGLDIKKHLDGAFPIYFSLSYSKNALDEPGKLETNLSQLYQYIEARKMYY